MSLEFTIYLWGLLDDLKVVASIASGCTFISSVFFIARYSDDEEDADKRRAFKSLVLAIPTLAIAVAIPSSKTFAAMVVLPKIARSEAVQKDIPELYNAAIEKLKSELSLTPEKR